MASVVFALLLLFVWIPLDTETGIVEKIRRRLEIGDAMAPTLAASILLVAGLLLWLGHKRETSTGTVLISNLRFLSQLLLVMLIVFSVMRWSGEIVVLIANVLGSEIESYRSLRDTAPWKYIGFFLGGTGLIAGLIFIIERRLNFKAIGVAVGVTLFLIIVYDLPFDDLLLPPNGDV